MSMKTILRCISPALLLFLSVSSAAAQAIVGITESDQLFIISDASAPGTISSPIAVAGLTAGQTIAGIDYRPNTGELYALGYNYGNGDAQIYRINLLTALATAVNSSPVTLSLGTGSIGF